MEQDDPDDIHREIARMASIYQHGSLCLSILQSPSSDTGFLKDRATEQAVTRIDGADLVIRDEPWEARRKAGVLSKHSSPLETRVWCLQERMLAPTLLHFGPTQLIWECNSGFASEARPKFNSALEYGQNFVLDAYITRAKAHINNAQTGATTTLWYRLVENYSVRQLTNSSDRLPAIAGLATRFQASLERQYEYCYGLWLQDLHVGLLWRVKEESAMEKSDTYIQEIPSWSWASLCAPVVYDSPTPHPGDRKFYEAKIERENEVIIDSESLGSRVLYVESFWLEGTVYREAKPQLRENSTFVPTATSAHQRFPCYIDHLDGCTEDSHKSVCLLIFAYTYAGDHAAYTGEWITRLCFLILTRASCTSGETEGAPLFRRVGMGWLEKEIENHSPLAPFKGCVKEKIALV